jgi:hypothetical protein
MIRPRLERLVYARRPGLYPGRMLDFPARPQGASMLAIDGVNRQALPSQIHA